MRKTGIRRAALMAAVAVSTLAFSGDEGLAQQLSCGKQLYTVQAGDSLSEIAQRAYSSFNYGVIFDANRDVLDNPAVLLVGQQLFIPCLDGSGPATKAAALGRTEAPEPAEAEVEQAAEPAPDAADEADAPVTRTAAGDAAAGGRAVRFLTGSDFAPFTHRDLPEGGMLTDVVNRAMQRADPSRGYEITWENDWSRHLSELLPEGTHDLGFPWYRLDCSVIEKLSPGMQKRCTDFHFSRPLYEVVVGYYLSADAPELTATSHDALLGKTLCRPSGYFTFDLEEVDLVEPNIEMVMPPTPGECFEMLAAGEADVVAINIFLGEREIAGLGLEDSIAEAPDLASTETLHVLTAKSNPHGRTYLRLIDKGLRQIRDEGVWFDITSRHLAEHAKSL